MVQITRRTVNGSVVNKENLSDYTITDPVILTILLLARERSASDFKTPAAESVRTA